MPHKCKSSKPPLACFRVHIQGVPLGDEGSDVEDNEPGPQPDADAEDGEPKPQPQGHEQLELLHFCGT